MTSPRIHSFDVFDTALVRTWARPSDLFQAAGEELGRRGFIGFSPERWRILRIKAEQEARRRSRTEETTLEEIYRVLAEKTGWSPENRDAAARLETVFEARALRPVVQVLERIRSLRRSGQRIVFLSDMYLDAETIRGFLAECGLWKTGDGLYVSAEAGVTKASGLLYEACLNAEKLSPGEMRHLGDNPRTDVRIPRALKIEADLFPDAGLNRYERRIADDRRIPLLVRSRIAGTARAARLGLAARDRATRTIIDVSASVAGPVLLGYVSWCLTEAVKQGLRRLYFVSRDGQILLRIAERVRAALGIQLECRYLFGSRQAFHLPALEDFGGREFDWLLDETSFLSVRSLFGRLGMAPGDFLSELETAGFCRTDWDMNIPLKSRSGLKPIFKDSAVRIQVKERAAAARNALVDYLKQEGVCDGTPWGLVDMGWRGRLQNSLSRIIEAAGTYPAEGVSGFYLALFDPVAPFKRDRVSVFLDESGGQAAAAVVRDHVPVLEVFTAADHGVTLGFRRGPDGRAAPVLAEERNQKALAWGIGPQQEAISRFADEWVRAENNEAVPIRFWIVAARSLLGLFLKNPTAVEAAVYGDYLYSEDQTDQSYHRLAPLITARRFWTWCFTRGPLISRVTWVEASVRRSLRGAGFFLAVVRLKSAIRKRLRGRRRR